MQFYFIRHAQSENNLLWINTGSSEGRSPDPDLTALGRQQAEHLARFLRGSDAAAPMTTYDNQNVAGFGVTHLYCSLMLRAVETGVTVARALDLPLTAWSDIHECGGIWTHASDDETAERQGLAGNDRAFFAARYPELILPSSLDGSGWWNRPFEELEQRPERARRVLYELLERHGQTDDRVAIISHGGFYNHFLAVLLELPQRDGYWFILNNVAITRIDFNEHGIDLAYMNRVDFLPKELIT